MDEYIKINTLEEIAEIAEIAVNEVGEIKLNFVGKFNFVANLINESLEDVHDIACSFQESTCPSNLHMNHGMYIHKKSDGIANIINELRSKRDSNRALISLINQDDIVGSGDKPIPSFLILQFNIVENILFVTAYFRALEVSKFLRINLEEIRIVSEKIKNVITDIKEINLTIFAFRAYIQSNINTLERAKIDQLNAPQMFVLLKNDCTRLIDLLTQKLQFSTIIEYECFKRILEWIEDGESSKSINPIYLKPLVRSLLNTIIEISKKLKQLRERSSHSEEIKVVQQEYIEKLNNLIRELRS